MNGKKVWIWSFTVSMGGFLFGFDTAVISGAEQWIQREWSLSQGMIGQMVAMALYGTVIGALIAGKPADIFGRKKSLLIIGWLYLISALGSAAAPDIWSLMIFRIIGGLGVGASSVVAPMYIAEIAPAAQRGRLTALFQFNLVLGILAAYASNYVIGQFEPENWRLMLGIEVVPSALFLGLLVMVHESPRWLLLFKKDAQQAMKVLCLTMTQTEAVETLKEIQSSSGAVSAIGLKEFFSTRYRKPILLAFLIAFFNQVSGINAVIYYAPRIFELAGMEHQAALLSTSGIGLVNMVFTVLGVYLIDRVGRRTLMFIGSVGYIISLSLVSMYFYEGLQRGADISVWIFLFIASHAIGQGAVIWVFISEVFPNQARGWGQSFGCGTHWVMAAIIAGIFPFFASAFGAAPIFAFFAFCMLIQLIFVWRWMPETKGTSLEMLEYKIGG